jgi:hypothetical protein
MLKRSHSGHIAVLLYRGGLIMRKVFILLLSAISFYLLLLQAAYAQNYGDAPSYQISVYSVSSRYIGVNYRPVFITNWHSSGLIQQVIDGWEYEITLTIKLTGENLVWKTPIGVTLIFPDIRRQTEIINKESMPLYSNNLYEFRFDVICSRKGWVMIQMSPLREWDELNIRNVDFRVSQVRIE